MPSTTKSPHATSFKTAIKNGTPAGKAVESIAKRKNTKPDAVFNSLYKAGLCDRQKFNGKWIYWPVENIKTSATKAKTSQIEMWQHFIDWCIASGNVKPQQLSNNVASQQNFMSYCKKFWNRQLTANGTSRTGSRKSPKTRRATSRTRTSGSYKFPKTRRYSRAA